MFFVYKHRGGEWVEGQRALQQMQTCEQDRAKEDYLIGLTLE